MTIGAPKFSYEMNENHLERSNHMSFPSIAIDLSKLWIK